MGSLTTLIFLNCSLVLHKLLIGWDFDNKTHHCAASSSYVLLLCISVFASGMNNDLLKKSIITTLQISRRDPSSKRNFSQQQQDSKSSLNCETTYLLQTGIFNTKFQGDKHHSKSTTDSKIYIINSQLQ